MAYPLYLREKARSMRREKGLTIDELADRLALSRSTTYYWVRDIPIARKPSRGFSTEARDKANQANSERYLRIRERAYANARHSFHGLSRDATFRDFICLYIGEGYKRSRNHVSVANSDPAVIELASRWIRRLSRNKVSHWLQYHADQDPDALCQFWANRLGLRPGEIKLQRKSNSNQLRKRTWRSRYGVLTVRVGDTQLRARLQGWTDETQRSWINSAESGRGAVW